MKRKIIILFATVICFHFFGFLPSDNKDDIEKVRNNNITSDEIYQHIKYLSSDELEGRFPGTAGDALTGEYIASEFKKYNLQPY